MIPDEGKVEFRIKENFVEVKNAGSWESVFKGEKGKIGFYKFSAPPDARICVTCSKYASRHELNEDLLFSFGLL